MSGDFVFLEHAGGSLEHTQVEYPARLLVKIDFYSAWRILKQLVMALEQHKGEIELELYGKMDLGGRLH